MVVTKTIYLICYAGPEWNNPIEAWDSKEEAEKRAKELNLTLSKTEIYDQLSKYVVSSISLNEKE